MIQNWLKKPYPFPLAIKEKLAINFGFGTFIFVFLALLKPFGFTGLGVNTHYFALVYALITFFTLTFVIFILPLIFKDFFKVTNWTTGKMLLITVLALFMISIFNYYFSIYNFEQLNVAKRNVIFFLWTTFVTGFFPITLYLYISEKQKAKANNAIALAVSKSKTQTVVKQRKTVVVVFGENKKEHFEFNIHDLLFISFEKNYATFFYTVDALVKTKLMRISLLKIEKQLEAYPFIIRCHKSYIVNTTQVNQLKGNARNYQLELSTKQEEYLIPVSRSFPKELLFTLIK